jgi:hypothetical protein
LKGAFDEFLAKGGACERSKSQTPNSKKAPSSKSQWPPLPGGFVDALGLPFQKEAGDYLHTEKLDGVKTFALWPLSQAAQSCFGSESWPSELPVPQAWLEFDVDDIEQAGTELRKKGYTLLTKAQKEPWQPYSSAIIARPRDDG